MDGLAVEISALTKRFGRVLALDGLDLTVERGQVVGFVGPNGAGKSTTIRILLGMLRPNRGQVRLLGGDPWRDVVELHQRLAYVPGDVTLWPHLTGGETIDLLLGMRGAAVDSARRDQMVQRFELDPSRRCGTYSKGNRQKVVLVAALASDVDLLILDEPTSGLDPLMADVFEQVIAEAAGRGTAVLLSSHVLAEVEALCDTVTLIRAGRAVRTGTLAQLRQHTHTQVSVKITGDAVLVTTLPGVHDVLQNDDELRFTVEDSATGAVLAALAELQPRSLTMTPPSLEDLFLAQYEVRA